MPLSDLMRNRFFPSQPSPQPYTDFAQQGSLMPYGGTGSGAGAGPFGTTPTIPSMGGSQGLWNPYAHLKPGDPHYGEQGDPDFQRGPWQMPPIRMPGGWRDQVPTGPIDAGGWPGAQTGLPSGWLGPMAPPTGWQGRQPPQEAPMPSGGWGDWMRNEKSLNPNPQSVGPITQGDMTDAPQMMKGGWGFGKGMR